MYNPPINYYNSVTPTNYPVGLTQLTPTVVNSAITFSNNYYAYYNYRTPIDPKEEKKKILIQMRDSKKKGYDLYIGNCKRIERILFFIFNYKLVKEIYYQYIKYEYQLLEYSDDADLRNAWKEIELLLVGKNEIWD